MTTPQPADPPFPPRAQRMVEAAVGTAKKPTHDRRRYQRRWLWYRRALTAAGMAGVVGGIALEVTTGHVVGASETAYLAGIIGLGTTISVGADLALGNPVRDFRWEAWDKWRLAIAVVDQLLANDREAAAKSWLRQAPPGPYRQYPDSWDRWLKQGDERLKPPTRRTLTGNLGRSEAAEDVLAAQRGGIRTSTARRDQLKKAAPAPKSEWTGYVEQAWRKVGALERVVATVRRGPLAERLGEVVRRAHELAEDTERIAVRAEAVSNPAVQRREMNDLLAAIQRAVDDVAAVASMNRDRDAAIRLRETTTALRDAHDEVAQTGPTATG